MQMNLMKEFPSPNVTHIIPKNLIGLPTYFNVISHGQGIFELNPTHEMTRDQRGIVDQMKDWFSLYEKHAATYPVTITGAKVDSDNCKLAGSTRFCTMDKQFAEYLTNIVSKYSIVDIIRTEQTIEQQWGMSTVEFQRTIWWEMINVSQYFRFMRYSSGGEHFPHYDSDFNYDYNQTSTKYSIVVYFNNCNSGELAFINDTTEHAKDKSDWTRQATNDEIWLKIKPSCMKIVLFPHTLCHTVLPFTDKDSYRYICRGDILFKGATR